jgi:hypothetical protein
MSGEQKRFDDLMKRVIKVTPEELRRRLKASKATKKASISNPTLTIKKPK